MLLRFHLVTHEKSGEDDNAYDDAVITPHLEAEFLQGSYENLMASIATINATMLPITSSLIFSPELAQEVAVS